jgi:hypothetical protein
MKNAYHILVRRPEGKRPLERPTCRWANIKMTVRKLGYKGVDRMHLDWIKVTPNAFFCEHGNEPSSSTTKGNFLSAK